MTNRFNLLLLLVALAAAVAGAGTALYLKSADSRLALERVPQTTGIQGMLWPNPKPVKPFRLTDDEGRPFDLDRLKGHWSFLFFGYTHCPDVCPMALDTLKRVSARLTERQAANRTQFVFVSVDPQRDTLEHLKSYVEYFNPDFIGATGDPDLLETLTRRLGIVYFLNKPDASGDYLVDHSASILLIDPAGRLVGIFSAPHQAADIADRFQAMRAIVEKRS